VGSNPLGPKNRLLKLFNLYAFINYKKNKDMSFTGFMFAFMLALLTFYVNQRIAKMTNIKIL
jgi:hypothetical protein